MKSIGNVTSKVNFVATLHMDFKWENDEMKRFKVKNRVSDDGESREENLNRNISLEENKGSRNAFIFNAWNSTHVPRKKISPTCGYEWKRSWFGFVKFTPAQKLLG